MQFDTKTVNKLLGVDESYKAPEKNDATNA